MQRRRFNYVFPLKYMQNKAKQNLLKYSTFFYHMLTAIELKYYKWVHKVDYLAIYLTKGGNYHGSSHLNIRVSAFYCEVQKSCINFRHSYEFYVNREIKCNKA